MFSEVTGGASGHDRLRESEFWAVNDISFELRRGECLGLIGHNGAGKTTMLKMLNGLIKPDAGRITLRGRVGALIALGAGFNPILTGRENIYVNGAVLGLGKQEIDRKIQSIIQFAELEEFIDSPVQSYSSGMIVRLGFAVAVILIEPDILFLDEVLAVGDIAFTVKCLNAVRKLTENAAVIFVSHNMQLVSSFCSRVLVMDHGRPILDASEPAEGIDRYYAMVSLEEQQSGTGQAKILNLGLCNDSGQIITDKEIRLQPQKSASVLLDLEVQGAGNPAQVSLYIMDEGMTPVMCLPVHDSSGELMAIPPGRHTLNVPLGIIELSAGKYSFTVTVMDQSTKVSLTRVQGLLPFRVFCDKVHWSNFVRPAIASIQSNCTSLT